MNSLSGYFEGIVAKRLSAVEADAERSNQHEFNAPSGLIKLLGKRKFGSKLKVATSFFYLDDTEDGCEELRGDMTYYESRQLPRSEHRIYYTTSPVTERFREGDLVVFAKKKDGSMVLTVAKQGSSSERQLLWLFSLSPESLEKTEYKDLQHEQAELGFGAKRVLENIGFEAIKPDDNGLSEILGKFGETFPVTKIFSEYARGKCGNMDTEDPDALLIAWITREEELFRALEKHIVGKRLKQGFGKANDDVDAFVDFSLSVHNRRKSRMGKSLENHLDFLFHRMDIRCSHGAATEGKKKPDFVFPGINEYRDQSFPISKLTILGAKSTCKDRWRQVLSEAERVPSKHLITLEPGISEDQTSEMRSSKLQLIVPAPLFSSYSVSQQKWLWSLKDLTNKLRKNQARL